MKAASGDKRGRRASLQRRKLALALANGLRRQAQPPLDLPARKLSRPIADDEPKQGNPVEEFFIKAEETIPVSRWIVEQIISLLAEYGDQQLSPMELARAHVGEMLMIFNFTERREDGTRSRNYSRLPVKTACDDAAEQFHVDADSLRQMVMRDEKRRWGL